MRPIMPGIGSLGQHLKQFEEAPETYRPERCSCCGPSMRRPMVSRPTATAAFAGCTAGVGRQKRSMCQVHRAGEKLFPGPTVEVNDGSSDEIRPAQILVVVLGASSYTYAEAIWTQTLPDWIASHQRALRFLGGVPEFTGPR